MNTATITAVATTADFTTEAAAERRLHEARRNLADALHEFRDATYADMRARLEHMDNAAADRYMRRVVRINSAGWTGGPFTDTNIIEALTRETYLRRMTAAF